MVIMVMKILPGETGRGGDSWALLHDHLLPVRLHAAHPHSGRQVHHHRLLLCLHVTIASRLQKDWGKIGESTVVSTE